MKVLFISLGCDKNLADSEEMLGLLTGKGHEIVDSEEEAEVIPAVLSMMQKKRVLKIFWKWQSIKKQEPVKS